jgi:hypothetical protein
LLASTPRSILARMLANLKSSYRERGDAASLVWVGRLRAAIPGVPRRELADLAQTLVGLGRFGEAADALDELAGTGGHRGERLRLQAVSLRARLN